jgi:PKD repeat protein
VEVNLYEIQFKGIATGVGPVTFSWNFGDPLSGASNTSSLQDPYHIFSNPGTYTVVLTTVDSNNCSSTFSSSITLGFFGTHTLLGQIKAGNQTITSCKVQLFSQDENGNMNLVQEVNPDSANYYSFGNVGSGIYRILAIPLAGTAYAPQYLLTYFGNSYLWETATPIVLGQPANSYNINLIPYDSISGGAGQINGGLTTGGKSMNVGNQEILILDNTNTPVKCLFTLPDGSFSFAGLPYGEYKVYPVITGITTHPVTVVLSETNKTATVIMKISGQSVSGFGQNQKESIIANVFPNPASDKIFATVKSKGSIQLMIIDASGRTIFEKQVTNSDENNVIELSVSALKPGIYLLVAQDENGNTSSQRFVKK